MNKYTFLVIITDEKIINTTELPDKEFLLNKISYAIHCADIEAKIDCIKQEIGII